MQHTIVLSLLVLAAVAACRRDESAESPPQQTTASPAVPDTARPSAPAPTPTTTAVAGTKAPAQTAVSRQSTASSAELASAARVLTVQVGAFLNAAAAQSLRARLERAGAPAWTTTASVGGQDFTRVRIGATTTPADARALAQKIRAEYHWPVWITTVENRSALPSDVLDATRTYAGGR